MRENVGKYCSNISFRKWRLERRFIQIDGTTCPGFIGCLHPLGYLGNLLSLSSSGLFSLCKVSVLLKPTDGVFRCRFLLGESFSIRSVLVQFVQG